MSDVRDTNGDRDRGIISSLLKLLGIGRSDPSLRESLEEVIEEHTQEHGIGSIGPDEITMLSNILRHGDLRIEEIMVPRADMVAVDLDMAFADILDLFIEAGHSRLPLYKGTLDQVIGMVHVKDALAAQRGHDGDINAIKVVDLKRSVLFVAPSMRAMDLLAKMRANRIHMAIVVDEYGGTDGLLTIEDLVEQIVGEIEDEHDQVDPVMLRQIDDHTYDLDARMPIDDLEEALERTLIEEDREEDVDTVGGLVFTLAGSVPQIGDVIDHPAGLTFEVVDADPRRIARLRVTLSRALSADDG